MEQTNFPWAYPELFTNILLMTDFKTILNTRLTCTSFRDWFNKNKIWKKYLRQRTQVKELFNDFDTWEEEKKSFTTYRLNRLLKAFRLHPDKLTESEAFVISCKMHKIVRQHELFVPCFPRTTCGIALRLEMGANEEDMIKSFGPILGFIRIKVKSPVVTSIVTEVINTVNNLLTCLVVDRVEKVNNQAVKDIAFDAFRHREVQLVYAYFNPEQSPMKKEYDDVIKNPNLKSSELKAFIKDKCSKIIANLDAHSADLEGTISSNSSSNPMDQSNQRRCDIARAEKRSLLELQNVLGDDKDDVYEPRSKKAKTSKEEPSVYSESKPSLVNSKYPTILELLDFDNPVLKEVLIERCNIDKILVIPSLDQLFLQQSNLKDIIPGDFEAVGRDIDGLVSKIKPIVDVRETDESTVIHLENIEQAHGNQTRKVMFWEGMDIKNRWSGFAEQLSQEDTQPMEIKKSTNYGTIVHINLNPPYEPEEGIPDSLPEIEEMLEARGTLVQRI